MFCHSRTSALIAIVMCEVLEHLNFNPLPLIKEINRVGKPNSLFYLSLPNQAYYRNRLKLLFGYFSQFEVILASSIH
jgi:hypothetical protein